VELLVLLPELLREFVENPVRFPKLIIPVEDLWCVPTPEDSPKPEYPEFVVKRKERRPESLLSLFLRLPPSDPRFRRVSFGVSLVSLDPPF
jgi:hypothetical protein